MSTRINVQQRRSRGAYSFGLALLSIATAPTIAQADIAQADIAQAELPKPPQVLTNSDVNDFAATLEPAPMVTVTAPTSPELEASVTFTQRAAIKPVLITSSIAAPEGSVDIARAQATRSPQGVEDDRAYESVRSPQTRHDVALSHWQRSSFVAPPETVMDSASPSIAPSSVDVAQTRRVPAASPATPTTITSPEGSATQPPVYTIEPRLGVRYNSANTGHEYGYFSLETFAPFWQVPGNSVTFFEGRVLVQQNGAVGSNLLLGQRFYTPQGDRTYGGYISYDTRNTGRSFFSQIGLGLETLGTIDARLNVYIPTGITRNRVADGFTGAFAFIPSATGIGTNLAFDRRQEFEAAATAVDLEAGGKITALGDRGTLRGYAGLYYLSPPGSPSVVGVKGRLEALPTDFLNVGVSLQHDGLYNTRAAFTIGVTFPGSAYTNSPNRYTLPNLRGIDRLGEAVARQNAIHVADPTIAGQRENSQVLATSTITGNPLRILLVNQTGGAGGNGTEATPFTDTATAVGSSAAGDIVFALANAGAPASGGFTIPDQVSVLSTQSQVPINAVEVSNIQLNAPFTRGAGILVPIAGTVVMGNNTVLSGYDVSTAGTAGIQSTGTSNILIRDNTIASTNANAAIDLANLSGTADIINNQVTAIDARGVAVNGSSATLSITNNTLTATRAAAIRMDNTTGDTTIANNTATTNTAPGFNLQNIAGNVAINNNVVTASGVGNDGILVNNTAGNLNLALTGNRATGGNNGIFVSLGGTATGGGTIANNIANNSGNSGIFIRSEGNANTVFTIANNTVTGNGFGLPGSIAAGIGVEARGASQSRVVLDSNTVTGNNNADADGGLLLITDGTATLLTQVSSNTLTDDGAAFRSLTGLVFSPGSRLCIQPNSNIITTLVQTNFGGTFQIEGALPGTNTITNTPAPTGVVTTVAAGTCGF